MPTEWESGEIVRRVDVESYWSGTGTLVAILSKVSFYVLQFQRHVSTLAHNRICLVDQDINVYAYDLSLAVVEYRTAIPRGDMDAASEPLVEIPAKCKTGPYDSRRHKVNFFPQSTRSNSRPHSHSASSISAGRYRLHFPKLTPHSLQCQPRSLFRPSSRDPTWHSDHGQPISH